MTTYRISFQLYSARKFPPVAAQLEALAAIGYDAVEPYGGAYGSDPAGFRRQLDAVGLACPTAHMPLDHLDADRAAVIGQAQTLGLETVVVPHIAADKRPADATGWKAICARLTGHAAALAEKGLKLAWHNHDFEYRELPDGTRPIEHLVGAAGVYFEPDIGWIVRAGRQPAAEIARFQGKVAAFHVKDVAATGVSKDGGWTDVGAGTIDWKGLWPTISGSGAGLLVLEHDEPSDWRGFAARSFTYLGKLTGRG
jgi:sugar phosphate isomerase/epimerase